MCWKAGPLPADAMSRMRPPSRKFLSLSGPTVLRWRSRLADLRGRGVYAGYPNRHRCIFIHIPKTAGSSIVEMLFNEPSRHIPYFVYRDANPEKFRQFFKFAFVRNPWDRLVSTYFFLREGGVNEDDRRWSNAHFEPLREF